MRGFFITAIPKSGTHLLASLVSKITGEYPTSVRKVRGENASYEEYGAFNNLVGHFRLAAIEGSDSLRNLFVNRQTLVLVRDPRAICNSMLHYLMASENAYHLMIRQKLVGLTFDEQIMQLSKGLLSDDGSYEQPGLDKLCGGFIEILGRYPQATLFRFEELFDDEVAVNKISGVFGIEASRAHECLADAIQGGSRTKREGKPDGWRAAFSQNLMEYFDTQYGALIAQLGYK